MVRSSSGDPGPQPRKRDDMVISGLSDRLGRIGDPRTMFERMFVHSPVPHLIVTADGSLVACNPAYRELFGLEPPPEFNLLSDDRFGGPGIADAARRALAGEAVQLGPIWCQRDAHTGHNVGRRLAVACSVFPLL